MFLALRAVGSLSPHRAYWGNATLLALDGLALAVANDLGGRGPWLVAFAFVCASGLAAWAGNTRRQRWIENVATSRIASAAQGYVELSGRVDQHPGELLPARLSQTPCVWYRYQIEKKDSGGDWRVEEYGSSDQTFLMDDGSGACVVDPDGAEITTSHKRTWTEGSLRYTEYLLLPGDELYALGEFRTLGQDSSAGDFRQDVGRLLAEWKTDRPGLLRRFDANGDGEIDLAEWDKARTAAEAQVAAEQRERAPAALNILGRPETGRPFLLSNLGHDGLARRYRRWAWAHLGVFLAGCAGLAYWAPR
jgi:hypothetical protein